MKLSRDLVVLSTTYLDYPTFVKFLLLNKNLTYYIQKYTYITNIKDYLYTLFHHSNKLLLHYNLSSYKKFDNSLINACANNFFKEVKYLIICDIDIHVHNDSAF